MSAPFRPWTMGQWLAEVIDLRLFLLQSAQLLLPSSLSRVLMVCWFWAARSAAGFGGALLDMAFDAQSNEDSSMGKN